MLKNTVKIILADDHPMMLKGLQQELESVGYTIIGTAENGALAVEIISKLQPDIAFIDIEMPLLNGFEVIKHCKDLHLKTRFIAMTYHKQKGFVVQAKKVGVHGYLLKEDSIQEIEKCIQEVFNGNAYYSSSFEENFENAVENEIKKIKQLTPSERTILRLISNGENSTEIAKELSVSARTVQKHRSNIIAKLQLENVSDSLLQWTRDYKEIIIAM